MVYDDLIDHHSYINHHVVLIQLLYVQQHEVMIQVLQQYLMLVMFHLLVEEEEVKTKRNGEQHAWVHGCMVAWSAWSHGLLLLLVMTRHAQPRPITQLVDWSLPFFALYPSTSFPALLPLFPSALAPNKQQCIHCMHSQSLYTPSIHPPPCHSPSVENRALTTPPYKNYQALVLQTAMPHPR